MVFSYDSTYLRTAVVRLHPLALSKMTLNYIYITQRSLAIVARLFTLSLKKTFNFGKINLVKLTVVHENRAEI